MKWFIRIGTHLAAVAVGFALGIYALPILIAPPSPEAQEVQAVAAVSELNRHQFARRFSAIVGVTPVR
ncbi:MAG: hypothetical protein AAGA44_14900 [Pseudomonadota bacterium]